MWTRLARSQTQKISKFKNKNSGVFLQHIKMSNPKEKENPENLQIVT